MTLTLILMRHAKSAWDDPLLDDYDRPLNARGHASAEALGVWLAEQGALPDEVVVSGAKRTVETWVGISGALECETAMRSERKLYLAPPGNMLSVLRNAQGATLLLIGHNPGIAEFASQLVSTPPDHPRFRDYPTGATTIMRFSVETWKDVGKVTGQVVSFVVPRELVPSP